MFYVRSNFSRTSRDYRQYASIGWTSVKKFLKINRMVLLRRLRFLVNRLGSANACATRQIQLLRFSRCCSTSTFHSHFYKTADKKNKLFPSYGLGSLILPRKHLVDQLFDHAQKQTSSTSGSVGGQKHIYISGIPASGKTSLLHLLASKLEESGYVVYFFPTTSGLSGIHDHIAKDSNVKYAIFVDDISSHTQEAVRELFRNAPANAVIIGAGVPLAAHHDIGNCYELREELRLAADGEEMQQLADYWKEKTAGSVSEEDFKEICMHHWAYFGGILYPIAKHLEYTFTLDKERIASYHSEFYNQTFHESDFYKDIKRRCLRDVDTMGKLSLVRVMMGREKAGDMDRLRNLGLWMDRGEDCLYYAFLRNYALECASMVGHHVK